MVIFNKKNCNFLTKLEKKSKTGGDEREREKFEMQKKWY